MTREEAAAVFNTRIAQKNGDKSWADSWVDALLDLGLLKLEPSAPSAEDLFITAWVECTSAANALAFLAEKGVKITR